jgi:DNA-binding NarL/FixJ family response regulator
VGLRILIVDDNPHLRGALRKFLEKRPDWVIAGEASDGVEAVEKAAELKPDVILMDVTMPRLSGFTATRLIRGKAPQCEIVILSQHPFALMGDPARKAGARAYVEKSEMATALLPAIEAASRHEPKPMPDPEPLPP